MISTVVWAGWYADARCYDHLCRKYQENIETKLKNTYKNYPRII